MGWVRILGTGTVYGVMLHLVSHPLPVAWDGRRVDWDRWEAARSIHICPPPKASRCGCGSASQPFTARGLRNPSADDVERAALIPRIGRRPPSEGPHPVYDLAAFRCPECGEVQVWDRASDEWWTLGPEDYGPEGSRPPGEWTGGLFDLLPESIG